MDEKDRLFVFSTLECVRAAVQAVDAQVAVLADETSEPAIEEALCAIRMVEVEAQQATSELMHRMLERSRA